MSHIRSVISRWYLPVVSCMILCLHYMLIRSISLLFVASIERFDVSRTQASFPYTLRFATEHFLGPVIGFLGCKFEVPWVIFMGCLLAAVAVGFCFFAESILAMSLLWGVLFGAGCGTARHLIPELLSRIFKEDLAKATGIAFMGPAIGAFVGPPIVEKLLEIYGLSGAFLIMSAICLHAVPLVMFLFRVSPPVASISIANKECKEEILLGAHSDNDAKDPEVLLSSEIKLTDIADDMYTIKLLSYHKNEKNVNNMIDNRDSVQLFVKSDKMGDFNGSETSYDKSKSLVDSDILPANCPCIINESVIENTNFQEEVQEPISTISKSETNTENKCKEKYFRVFLDPLFQLIAILQSLPFFLFLGFGLIIVDFAADKEISIGHATYILMGFAVGELLGSIGFGWVIDKGILSPIVFSAIEFLVLAFAYSILTLFKRYFIILFLSSFIGMLSGMIIVIQLSIVTQFFKGKQRIMAIASRSMYLGPLSLTTSLLVGFIRGTSGSYNGILYLLSSISFVCGCITLLLPAVSRSKCRIHFTSK